MKTLTRRFSFNAFQLYETGKTEVLVAELSELDVVSKVLRAGDTRSRKILIFQ